MVLCRYYAGVPLFTYGSGLSYTKFDLACSGGEAAPPMTFKCTVTNTGTMAGDEVVLV